jgi:hypothetical protein
MTDVAATELIAESSEDREQGRDEVAAVSDLLRGRNEWSIEMRGRERVESKAALEADRHAVDAQTMVHMSDDSSSM